VYFNVKDKYLSAQLTYPTGLLIFKGIVHIVINPPLYLFHFTVIINSSFERVEGFKYLETILKIKIPFRKKLRAV
jgi:hypothetical protein